VPAPAVSSSVPRRQNGEGVTTAIGRRFGSHSTLLESLAVGALAVVLLALRAPFALDRLWAEDGSIFLQQPINRGLIQPFGQAYAGYYLVVPCADLEEGSRVASSSWMSAPAFRVTFSQVASTMRYPCRPGTLHFSLSCS
jgi:hypothetical protein